HNYLCRQLKGGGMEIDMKKSSKIRKSIALMIVSVSSFSVVAYADNAYVSGELNRSGSGLSTVN
ncbi:MAG: hypothetical protein ACLSVM_10640, partial [Coprococcus phoceensis]